MDPYAVGYLSGTTVVLAVIGYWVGRKLVGPSGTDEVARLKHIAGIAEAGTKPPSPLRGVVPYLLALGGALTGLVVGVVSLVHQGKLLSYDPVKLEQGFLSGCARTCAASNGSSQVCEGFCACVLGEVKRDHPSPESLQSFFQAALDEDSAAQRELQAAQSHCVEASQNVE